MQPEPDPKLEALLDVELKQLPLLPAPARLSSQVLSVLKARAQVPWWQRAWWDWPLSAKAAFVILGLTIVAAFSGGGFAFGTEFINYSNLAADKFAFGGGVAGPFASLGNVAGLLWEKSQSVLLYVLLLAGILYLACLALGTACVRCVLKHN